MKQLLLSVVAGIAVAAWGNNLFPEDTDFETGTQNFRYYRSAEPIRTVSGDAASGNSSLEIDSAVSWAHGRWGYAIRKDTDYTVSFSARRVSGGDTIAFALIGVLDWKQVGFTQFRLTDEWRRYRCRIRTDRAGTVLYPAFLPQGEIVFRIDAIQLEEGSEATPYRHSEAFSIFPMVNGAGSVVHTPEVPRLAVNAFNAGVPPEGQPFTLRVGVPGTEIRRERSFRLEKGKTAVMEFELAEAAEPGYYPAEVEVLDNAGRTVKSSAAPFVVTAPFPPPSREGFFGMQDSSLPQSVLPRIGVSYLRSGFTVWKAMEPREGEFREYAFQPPPELFWHPTIQSEFAPGRVPAWGCKPGSTQADPAKAALFMEQLFRQLRGKTEYLDFINEPDLELRNMPDGAEYYGELLKTAAPIARKYGIRLLAGVSGNRSDFTEKVLTEAHGSIDILGPHPYCSPRSIAADGRYCAPPEQGEFAGSMRYHSELARKYGKEFLIGELGYSLEESIPFHAPEAHRHAAWLARMFLIARSYPECRRLVWFTGLDRWEGGPFLYGIWRTENGIRPLPAVAACAQAAHEIDRADAAELLLDGDIKLLRLRRGNHTSYAVWDSGGKPEKTALRELPAGAAPRSIYGTPVRPGEAAITEAPLYLSENAAGTVLAALLRAIDSRPPLTVRAWLRERNHLKLEVKNRSFSDWKGTVAIPGVLQATILAVPRQSAETVTVKTAAAIPAAFAVKLAGENGKEYRNAVELPVPFEIPKLAVSDLEKFDFVSKLNGPGSIVQQTREHLFPPDPSIPWSGPADLSHRTLLGWDEENLYIFSEVRDDMHRNRNPDHAAWRGDSIQIGIDSHNDADGRNSYGSDDTEFTFALNKKPWNHHAPPTRRTPAEASGVRQFITRSEESGTTVYRIAIPRKLLAPLKLKPGTVFGAALCFNDADEGKVRRYMTFGGGIADRKCPALFRKAVLAE